MGEKDVDKNVPVWSEIQKRRLPDMSTTSFNYYSYALSSRIKKFSKQKWY